jgi:hypothetical protein
MIKLRGIPPKMLPIILEVHGDVFDEARTLLRHKNFVIYEEALYRARRLKHRKDMQWPAIFEELKVSFPLDVITISCATFREAVNAKINPLPTIRHVRDYLEKMNGNETAGLSFVHWKRDVTERKIVARRHTATGFENSADQLQVAMDQAVQIAHHATQSGSDDDV